ncbi:MAG TPA: hypothetical protein VEB63_00240 [Chitinophagaceae bacterium]|nr:hypothetical protein [Chitinophagaceae bacterium]
MKLFPAFGLLTLVIACNKDKFTTVPQVQGKSISPETVFQGDIIRFVSKFTDKEGDLDSLLVIYKWYSGTNVTRVYDTMRETLNGHNLPASVKDGEIVLQYSYNQGGSGRPPTLTPVPANRDTVATLGIIVIDKAGNRSNYAESGRITLKEQ